MFYRCRKHLVCKHFSYSPQDIVNIVFKHIRFIRNKRTNTPKQSFALYIFREVAEVKHILDTS